MATSAAAAADQLLLLLLLLLLELLLQAACRCAGACALTLCPRLIQKGGKVGLRWTCCDN
jgi:hypothetical protein